MSQSKGKVAVGMSGGVDSSVAAALLKDQGYEVIGVFLRFWSDPTYNGDYKVTNKCCSVESLMDARRVADSLGIELVTLNTSKRFKELIVDNFLDEFEAGKTPNPCVICNQFIKVGYFLELARELGCEYVATGHYAKTKLNPDGSSDLLTSADEVKDQTYFLYRLNQDTVKHLLLPIGGYKKEEVRKIAKSKGLPVAEKSDSFDISFIPDKTHNEFLQRWLKPKSGKIVTTDGELKGEHEGLMLYTLGQRQGIKIGGPGGPWYVVEKRYLTNELVVSSDKNYPGLFATEIKFSAVNWINKIPKEGQTYQAKIRHQQKVFEIELVSTGNMWVAKAIEPQRAVTPGQSIVIYDQEIVLGGGIIE